MQTNHYHLAFPGTAKSLWRLQLKTNGRWLGLYKQVREAITRADPARQGIVGGSPELHEKIDPASGCGAVAVFAEVPATYRLVTRTRVAREYVATEGVTVRFDTAGRALLDLDFRKPGAKLVFFGVREP